MGVVHILKDGSVVNDIAGKVVKFEDASILYQLINNINSNGSKKSVHSGKTREVKVC